MPVKFVTLQPYHDVLLALDEEGRLWMGEMGYEFPVTITWTEMNRPTQGVAD